jgi:hypothetical protein
MEPFSRRCNIAAGGGDPIQARSGRIVRLGGRGVRSVPDLAGGDRLDALVDDLDAAVASTEVAGDDVAMLRCSLIGAGLEKSHPKANGVALWFGRDSRDLRRDRRRKSLGDRRGPQYH